MLNLPIPAFNAMVAAMASRVCPTGFDVSGVDNAFPAPTSLPALQAHVARTGRILVDGAHSARTIYGEPEFNFAFRAWHDWTHWTLRAEFDLPGELAVAYRQVEDMHRVFGYGGETELFASLIVAEVYGQALYLHRCGEFPQDQVEFTRAYLAGKIGSEEMLAIRDASRRGRATAAEDWTLGADEPTPAHHGRHMGED